MPLLACWNCGRQVYATAPLASLFVDERRCPRCGVQMNLERRVVERRMRVRRQNPPGHPGPPADAGERRLTERRFGPRRRGS
jgi:DNA-directed RNA polymerase subunit RPC12/RpoP